MAKFEKKEVALKMRRRGKSLNEISKELTISKSTASAWCSSVELSQQAVQRLEARSVDGRYRGRLLGSKRNREARLLRVRREEDFAAATVGNLTTRDLLLAGIALYWGEGSKGRKFSFSNSDVHALQFFLKWLLQVMSVAASDVRIYVFINSEHSHRVVPITKYWSKQLDIPQEQFANPTLLRVKNKKVYENEKTYYGVVSVRVRKSTLLQYRVLGLIKALHTPA